MGDEMIAEANKQGKGNIFFNPLSQFNELCHYLIRQTFASTNYPTTQLPDFPIPQIPNCPINKPGQASWNEVEIPFLGNQPEQLAHKIGTFHRQIILIN